MIIDLVRLHGEPVIFAGIHQQHHLFLRAAREIVQLQILVPIRRAIFIADAEQQRIAQERDEILQDWLNIVVDRGLKQDNFSPAVGFGP